MRPDEQWWICLACGDLYIFDVPQASNPICSCRAKTSVVLIPNQAVVQAAYRLCGDDGALDQLINDQVRRRYGPRIWMRTGYGEPHG